ncbi:phosphotransferase enzyme family-domain-containing protein [Triangularia verruculosa]|uniref:Phosphotransferase enzyme family-domain-containing protein n=1 Tax=Triangularia verruculosa TaxID=2587418 RepID=A0AAN7AXL6_9PEZI|nr:phosphotransferase enzyme family-domain-containing protein [Triangularia verruculosa]
MDNNWDTEKLKPEDLPATVTLVCLVTYENPSNKGDEEGLPPTNHWCLFRKGEADLSGREHSVHKVESGWACDVAGRITEVFGKSGKQEADLRHQIIICTYISCRSKQPSSPTTASAPNTQIMASLPRASQDGLEWKETLFDLVPQWTREPSIPAIENVCRQQLGIPSEDRCTVTFLTSGLFNKLYIVECATGPLIMRVTLPVYPRHKTRAEVATLRWVHENTTIPVPKVFGFDDNNENEVGFEWTLMELMEGTSAHRRWRNMSMEQKVAFTRQIAKFQAELSGFGKPVSLFRSIGTLDIQEFAQGGDAEHLEKVAPGLLVSHEFFMGDRLHYDVPRGPFHSSHDWLSAELNIILLAQTAVLGSTEDEDDREDAEEILPVARKLLSLVPKVFPVTLDKPEITALYHHDLHLNNILVNEEGEITAVLDWECVSAMPLWMSTKVPKFLDEPTREEEPQRDLYANETPEEAAAVIESRHDPDYLDNEGKNQLYFIHRMEYEATQLRKVYEATLRQLWPKWPLEESHAEIDFFQAIAACDGIWVKRARRWADCMEKGERMRFEDA